VLILASPKAPLIALIVKFMLDSSDIDPIEDLAEDRNKLASYTQANWATTGV
jgi:hypothetical protein